jgi:signal peptidase I
MKETSPILEWFRGARRKPAPTAEAEREPTRGELWRENIESLVWAVALALLIRTFVMAPFKIPSGSMRTTLIEGDRILVNKYIYRFKEPERGDIIVFKYPVDGKRPFIKRLIGKGGEKVEIRDSRIFINGQETAEPPILGEISYYNQGDYGKQNQVIEVPEGQYFVLGDNSASSHDSRFWGFVPRKNVIGKALCIFWPPTRLRGLR